MVNLDKSSEDELLRFRELDYRTTVLISGRQRKLGEEKYFLAEEKKNGERGGGKYFCIGQDKRSKKKRKMFLHGKRKKTQKKKEEHIFFCGGEGKGENYLEKGNTFLKRRRSTEKEMEENIMGKEKLLHLDGK